MESLGAFSNGEWEFFGKILASELEHELFTTPPEFLGENSSTLLVGDDGLNNIGLIQSTFCSEDMFCSNLQYISSQESSYNSSNNCIEDTNNDNVFIANQDLTTTNFYCGYYPNGASLESMDYFCMDERNLASFVPPMNDIENVKFNEDIVGSGEKLEDSDHTQMEATMVSPTTKQFQLKRKFEVPAEDETNNRSKNQKKKPCVSKDVQGCMKDARSRKNQKVGSRKNGNEAEDTYYNAGISENGQSSSSNISEDNNNNASQENSSVSQSALNSNGKPRASRGSATDPQSLYARKRRERINERLRILQNLVPNGTKVDISTMLEEAVNYVKFLQLQIKLLSSDDLWMYAPLAYNGIDIGLNLNMKKSPTL